MKMRIRTLHLQTFDGFVPVRIRVTVVRSPYGIHRQFWMGREGEVMRCYDAASAGELRALVLNFYGVMGAPGKLPVERTFGTQEI